MVQPDCSWHGFGTAGSDTSWCAHLYFEFIHPFEDGNGSIGRAIAEKVLVQGFGQPVIVALARSILAHHADYYRALEEANKTNEVTRWLR